MKGAPLPRHELCCATPSPPSVTSRAHADVWTLAYMQVLPSRHTPTTLVCRAFTRISQ